MNRSAWQWWLVALILCAGVAHGSVPQAGQPLAGTWEAVEYKAMGQAMPAETTKNTRLVIAGNKFTITVVQGDAREFTFKLDPTKKPATIDLTALNGPYKDKVAKGIYRLEKDTLTLCLPAKAGDRDQRPSEFTSDKESGTLLITLKKLAKDK